MTDLTTLADRVEAGTVEMQQELLEAAWLAARGQQPDSGYRPRETPSFKPDWEAWTKRDCRFRNLLQFGAYVDAAMMLKPAGWFWGAGEERPGALAFVHNGELAFVGIGTRPNPARRWYECRSETAALALAACCLRAHASEATNV